MLQRALVSFHTNPASLAVQLCKVAICSGFAAFSIGSMSATIGGSVTGLAQAGLQLQVTTPTQDGVSWTEVLAVPSGATQYTFTSNFNTQYGHSFSVVAQPPDSFCVLTREYALATDGGNIADVSVVCAPGKPLGEKGFVPGLVLQTGGQQVTAPLSSSGVYRFSQYLQPGDRFDVWVAAQPASWHCVVQNGIGTMASSVVSNIDVTCVHESNCSPDVDDDGRVLANTDGQIVNRLMRGLRGQAVLSGLNHPNARRNNWGALRDYLNLRCGMALP